MVRASKDLFFFFFIRSRERNNLEAVMGSSEHCRKINGYLETNVEVERLRDERGENRRVCMYTTFFLRQNCQNLRRDWK